MNLDRPVSVAQNAPHRREMLAVHTTPVCPFSCSETLGIFPSASGLPDNRLSRYRGGQRLTTGTVCQHANALDPLHAKTALEYQQMKDVACNEFISRRFIYDKRFSGCSVDTKSGFRLDVLTQWHASVAKLRA